MNDINFAKRIINLRIESNLTQIELAELLNIRQSTLSSWESGIRIPRYQMLKKLIEIGKKYEIEFTLDDILNQKIERKNIKNNKGDIK